MSTEQVAITIGGAVVAFIAIAWILRRNNFTFDWKKRQLKNQPVEPKPIFDAQDIQAGGSGTFENNQPGSMRVKGVKADEDVSVRNNLPK